MYVKAYRGFESHPIRSNSNPRRQGPGESLESGVRYRVLDARMHQGQMVVANPPAAWAPCRIFRPEQRQRRLYYLRSGEDRAPEPAPVELQLARAEHLPVEARHAPAPDPR